MKKSIAAAVSVFLFLLLLAFPKLSVQGASNGLLLWFHTIVPTLFPFMLCSSLIVSMGGVPWLIYPFRTLFGTVLGMSDYGSYVLILGLFCGCPMGAKTCCDFLKQGKISVQEARCLMAVCNQPSSMFLLGYMASVLDKQLSVLPILFCLYLPLFPLWFLARFVYHWNGRSDFSLQTASTNHISLDLMILASMETLVKIGGYLMIFSVLSLFIQTIFRFTPVFQMILLGLTEITTGIQTICASAKGSLQGTLVTAAISFGGLSCLFQIRSVFTSRDLEPISQHTKKDSALQNPLSLSISHYFVWKLIHTCLSSGLYVLIFH